MYLAKQKAKLEQHRIDKQKQMLIDEDMNIKK